MLQEIPSIDNVLREGSIDPAKLEDYIGTSKEALGKKGIDEFLELVCNNKSLQVEKLSVKLLEGTVMDVLAQVKDVINEETLVDSFVLAACETRKMIEKCIKEGRFPFELINRDFKSSGDNEESVLKEKYAWIQKDWFLQNAWMNWLRLIGIEDSIDYEAVHNNAGYNLIEKTNHSDFSYFIASYGSENDNHKLLNGKDVLTIGGGNGRDEAFWARKSKSRVDVKSIRMIEGSESAIKLMKETRNGIYGDNKEKLIIPDHPEDMFEALRKMKKGGEMVDTIYGLSVFHYFDDPKFKELFTLIKDCLRPGGYVAFAVKAPGTTFDGVGIPLINRGEKFRSEIGEKDTSRVYERVSLNLDGQARAFRDLDALKDLLKNLGFEIIHFGLEGIEQDYEFSQQGEQYFARFVIKKPNIFISEVDLKDLKQ